MELLAAVCPEHEAAEALRLVAPPLDVGGQRGLVDGLVVDTDRMADNLEATRGLVYSQAVLLALAELLQLVVLTQLVRSYNRFPVPVFPLERRTLGRLAPHVSHKLFSFRDVANDAIGFDITFGRAQFL